MQLSQKFRQRVVKPTFGSFRSRVPLRTPSGAQATESALETETLDQLDFVPGVLDLITQVTLDYEVNGKARRYSVDIAAEIASLSGEKQSSLFIEVKRADDLALSGKMYRSRFEAAQAVARAVGGVFRVITEAEIRTPYLVNARMLGQHVGVDPTPHVLLLIEEAVRSGPQSMEALISHLDDQGVPEPQARLDIERAIANRLLGCDLMRPLNDAASLRATMPMLGLPETDPFLASIYASRHGEQFGT